MELRGRGPAALPALDPASPTLTPLGYPIGAAWDDTEPTGAGVDFAPQGPACGGAKIQTNDSRIQNVVWRNGTLWATHTVFLPSGAPNRASVQWWQVQTNATVTQRGLVDDPTATRFSAFPSIAVNKNNDVLVGFSSFAASEPASARYAFRLATDPVNTLQTPSVLKPGEDCYYKDFSSGRNRWGDYSATVVDPSDDTKMWTVQEYAETSAGPVLRRPVGHVVGHARPHAGHDRHRRVPLRGPLGNHVADVRPQRRPSPPRRA